MSEWNRMSEWKRQVLKRCYDDFLFFKSVIENGLLKTMSAQSVSEKYNEELKHKGNS